MNVPEGQWKANRILLWRLQVRVLPGTPMFSRISSMANEPVPCPTCGGVGAERGLVCCGNWTPDRHGEAMCCQSPIWEVTGYCADCNGGGFVEAAPNLSSGVQDGGSHGT